VFDKGALPRFSRSGGLKEDLMRVLLVALTLFGFASTAFSQTAVFGSITLVRTGWNSDSFAIVTQEPIQNPAGCPIPDGYISEKSLPGYNTYYAAVLTAYAAKVPAVGITIHNTECFGGRPKLIGIFLQK
jgi:hypothetical protein